MSLLKNPCFEKGKHWSEKVFLAGQNILKEGENDPSLFLILEGSVRVVANINIGAEKAIHPGFADLKKHDVFGELSFIDNQPHSTNIEAIGTCKIAIIDKQSLIKFLNGNTDMGSLFYQSLSKLLAERLRKTNTKAFSLLAWGLNTHGIDEHLN